MESDFHHTFRYRIASAARQLVLFDAMHRRKSSESVANELDRVDCAACAAACRTTPQPNIRPSRGLTVLLGASTEATRHLRCKITSGWIASFRHDGIDRSRSTLSPRTGR